MIVKKLQEVLGTQYDVIAPEKQWRSRRLLLKKDQIGFSLHDTIIYPNTETPIWYKNHLEVVYCIEGEGEVEVLLPEKKTYQIGPGTVYVLNQHEKHILRARTQMRIICVFDPPCTGSEVHGKEGEYSLPD
ncbi:MAG: ectoine synthase [Nitrospirales bacterium]